MCSTEYVHVFNITSVSLYPVLNVDNIIIIKRIFDITHFEFTFTIAYGHTKLYVVAQKDKYLKQSDLHGQYI